MSNVLATDEKAKNLSNPMTNALVIGGNGFLGRHLVEQLVSGGVKVTSIVRQKRQDIVASEQFTFEEFQDPSCHKERSRFDCVFDLAANISVDEALKGKLGFTLENVAITLRNFSLVANLEFVGAYIYVGSDRGLVLDSGHNNLLDPYGRGKLIGSLLTKHLQMPPIMRTGTVILPNLWGAGQKSSQLLPTLIRRIIKGEDSIGLKSLDGGRNYLHVNDAARGLICLSGHEWSDQVEYLSGEYIELKHLLNEVGSSARRCLEREIKFYQLDHPEGWKREDFHSPPRTLDDYFARSILSWCPRMSIKTHVDSLFS